MENKLEKIQNILHEKYHVTSAFIFIGYVPSNTELYKKLQKDGFIIIFKPTIIDSNGKTKGNCDADLVLQALIEIDNYDKAVIVTSDGDFYSLVRYLYQKDKLEMVLSSHIKRCSSLLKIESKNKINYMNNLKSKIGLI